MIHYSTEVVFSLTLFVSWMEQQRSNLKLIKVERKNLVTLRGVEWSGAELTTFCNLNTQALSKFFWWIGFYATSRFKNKIAVNAVKRKLIVHGIICQLRSQQI